MANYKWITTTRCHSAFALPRPLLRAIIKTLYDGTDRLLPLKTIGWPTSRSYHGVYSRKLVINVIDVTNGWLHHPLFEATILLVSYYRDVNRNVIYLKFATFVIDTLWINAAYSIYESGYINNLALCHSM